MNKILQQTHEMIDNLKAICTNYGLGNTGNEYKIITETFLYKFLNDKFFYELKKTVPAFKSKTTRELEKILADMSDDERDSKMLYLSAHTAFLKPTQFISYLFNRHATKDFHKLFDDTLNDISDANKDIFSVKAGTGTSVKLFESLSNYIVQPERRDDFCAAIITKLADVNFEELFSQKYDFFAEIFEYLIKDYNKDFGKYAEYYTPKVIARIIAKILPTGFLTASTRIALKIRQHIINEKILRGVVFMPSNIFANTGTNVSVVFLDADGSDRALLIDASNLGTKQKIEGTKNQRTYLSDNEISRIIDTFNTRQEIEDFSVLVSLDEITQKNFSFSAGQYFKVKIEYIELSPEEFQEKMQGFQSDLQKFFDEGHQLERDILKQLENLTYEEN